MIKINDLVTRYVTFRRTLGDQYIVTERTLRSFCRAIGPRTPVTRIRLKTVAAYLAGTGPITRLWHFKHTALKGLFRFAVSRGLLKKAPLPTTVPKRPPTLVPYIYSRDEIRRLLDAIPFFRRPDIRVEPQTLRAMLLLLYGAGLRRGEALVSGSGALDGGREILQAKNLGARGPHTAFRDVPGDRLQPRRVGVPHDPEALRARWVRAMMSGATILTMAPSGERTAQDRSSVSPPTKSST
jgi:integrase